MISTSDISPRLETAPAMTITIIPSRYLLIMFLAFLTACKEQSVTQPIATASPTSVLPTATLTLEPTPDIPVPTPTPTIPGTVLITPDGVQVERWRDYQTALAKSVLAHLPPEEVLCEWDILGRSGDDVYVWAVCKGGISSGSVPAFLHLDTSGTIQNVERAVNWSNDIPKLFPPDVREKFYFYTAGRAGAMLEHIEWRRMHPDEPPLIILAATPTP